MIREKKTMRKFYKIIISATLLVGTLFAAEEELPALNFNKLIPIAIALIFFILTRKKKPKIDIDSESQKIVPEEKYSSVGDNPSNFDVGYSQKIERHYEPIEPK